MFHFQVLPLHSYFFSDPSMDDSGSVSPDQDDTREKMEKQKKKMDQAAKPKYEAKGNSLIPFLSHYDSPL